MSKDKNMPAFPQSLPDAPGAEGMTLRDYFAAKAMQGLLSNMGSGAVSDMLEGYRGGKKVSSASYMVADAMLEAREENQ